ncbi:Thioesterase superfamily [Penicillium expansum]|uniref:Thioesterase superfamily n=1 Tax=Penicillium expansum TaxID=27334 RepID=A0A0A2JMH8_PENEN|nr:Thioesterase superfamily [Penicillium expansum]KAJ5510111.1 Thioesterase superfamily [Penicillium expansum]KGO48702.1 Thioesterase superfamily [Penicillium expansum]KGO56031.1 Thioesterase superfamily [Penicillium expansum]KGO57183.1 Thioesterase superfamily [Penicillium expansum]
MSTKAITLPSRKLDEFEELVYDYTARVGVGSEGRVPALTLLSIKHWDIDARNCNLRFESATRGPPATVSFLFKVTPALSNFMGNLHGGCAATLIDVLSTTILLGVSEPGKFAFGGVSRNLKVTYLRPVPTGTEARLVCEVIHVGKRLALLRAEIQRAENGDICVIGEHEKANTDPEVTQRI